MLAEALASPWRRAFLVPGGSEPLSPKTLLIQGLDAGLDTPPSAHAEAQAGASVQDDWRDILRDLHPFKYEDMTISLGSPGMPPRGAAGWLSPVVLDSDALAAAAAAADAPPPHIGKFPGSMLSSRPIGGPPFMLGPPPKAPARRAKLRLDEEQEVADILVMLRSRAAPRVPARALPLATPLASPPVSGASRPDDGPAARAAKTASGTSASGSASDTSASSGDSDDSHSPLPSPAPSPVSSPADASKLEALDRLDSDDERGFMGCTEAGPGGHHAGHHSDHHAGHAGHHAGHQVAHHAAHHTCTLEFAPTAIVRDRDWRPMRAADPRPRRRAKSKLGDDDADAAPGARSVDQSNELEKMLRDIGFMAIRTERTSISCSLCHQRFPSRMFAVRHAQRDHLGVKPFECSICHMRFVRLDSVPRHIKNVHQRKTAKRKRKRSSKA